MLYELLTLSSPSNNPDKIEAAASQSLTATVDSYPIFGRLIIDCTLQDPNSRPEFEKIFKLLSCEQLSITGVTPSPTAMIPKEEDLDVPESKPTESVLKSTGNSFKIFTRRFTLRKSIAISGKLTKGKKKLLTIVATTIVLVFCSMIAALVILLKKSSSSANQIVYENASTPSSSDCPTPTPSSSGNEQPVEYGTNYTTGSFLDWCNSSSTLVSCGKFTSQPTVAANNSTTVIAVMNCIFDGCPSVSVLSPIIFINVTFKNGLLLVAANGGNGGGSISTNATAHFIDCSFINSKSGGNGAYGGALYANRLAVIVLMRVVISGSTSGGCGGAIYLDSSASLTMMDSTITGANSKGNNLDSGTIYCKDNCTVHVENSSISNCQSSTGATALYSSNSNSSISFINSTIASNLDHDYGAVYLNGGDIYINGLRVLNNTGGTNRGGGGMVILSPRNVSILNSEFTNNSNYQASAGSQTPLTWGGGLYIQLFQTQFRLINVTFSGNTATWGGGALCIEPLNPNGLDMIFSNVSFIQNTAVRKGGGALSITPLPDHSNQTFNLLGNMIQFSNNQCGVGAVGEDIALLDHHVFDKNPSTGYYSLNLDICPTNQTSLSRVVIKVTGMGNASIINGCS